jgi:hypothetical protein
LETLRLLPDAGLKDDYLRLAEQWRVLAKEAERAEELGA